MVNQKFPKSEKLKSSKTIEKLFLEGKSLVKFPVKLIFLPSEPTEITQAAFAVPKRNFKNAVDRNRIKRQLRETYRLNKQLLPTNKGLKFALLFLYVSKEKTTFVILEKSVQRLLKFLNDENNK